MVKEQQIVNAIIEAHLVAKDIFDHTSITVGIIDALSCKGFVKDIDIKKLHSLFLDAAMATDFKAEIKVVEVKFSPN